MIPDPNVIVFNNGIIERLQLENPYDLVREGKWTLDKMTEMASKVTAENGDTVWNHEDTYGFGAPDDWYLSSFIHGAVFDPTLSYFGFSAGTNDLLYSPDHMLIDTKANNFASWLATYGVPARAAIQEFNEAVAELD